jgi:alginate O-acetyltransferase complex protein AlgI
MLLCGLWHGAGWTFLLWGAMHGTFLVAHRLWTASGWRLGQRTGLLLTLLCVISAWVVFRAPTVESAFAMLRAMAFVDGSTLPPGYHAISDWLPSGAHIAASTLIWGVEPLLLAVLLWFFAAAPNIHEIELRPSIRVGAVAAIGFFASASAVNSGSTFLYASF